MARRWTDFSSNLKLTGRMNFSLRTGSAFEILCSSFASSSGGNSISILEHSFILFCAMLSGGRRDVNLSENTCCFLCISLCETMAVIRKKQGGGGGGREGDRASEEGHGPLRLEDA